VGETDNEGMSAEVLSWGVVGTALGGIVGFELGFKEGGKVGTGCGGVVGVAVGRSEGIVVGCFVEVVGAEDCEGSNVGVQEGTDEGLRGVKKRKKDDVGQHIQKESKEWRSPVHLGQWWAAWWAVRWADIRSK
jgi:hypothetical protein